jgi:hypothetical protein
MSSRFIGIVIFCLFSSLSFAATNVKVLGLRSPKIEKAVTEAVTANFDMSQYREMRIKIVGDHAVVFLFSKKYHRFDSIAVKLDQNGAVKSIERNYRLQPADRAHLDKPQCPDTAVQFIAFAPNDDDLEQSVTVDVATEAKAKGLKTVELLKQDATSQSYLN